MKSNDAGTPTQSGVTGLHPRRTRDNCFGAAAAPAAPSCPSHRSVLVYPPCTSGFQSWVRWRWGTTVEGRTKCGMALCAACLSGARTRHRSHKHVSLLGGTQPPAEGSSERRKVPGLRYGGRTRRLNSGPPSIRCSMSWRSGCFEWELHCALDDGEGPQHLRVDARVSVPKGGHVTDEDWGVWVCYRMGRALKGMGGGGDSRRSIFKRAV